MKSGRFWLIALLSVLATTLIAVRVVLPKFAGETTLEQKRILRAGKGIVMVEIADSDDERGQGLAGRDRLENDEGMLFVFDEPGRPSFWMKGMNFSLDFIWIYEDVVVEVRENVPAAIEGEVARTYEPTIPATMMLEVNAGWARQNGVKVGDRVTLE